MSDSIRTLAGVALVAAGLVAGAPAQAAQFTLDAGAACVGFTWNSTTNTLSCTVDTACVVSGPSTGTPGQNVVLTASCPTSSTITWDGGSCAGQTGSTCTANEATTGNVTYGATGNTSVRGTRVVNWTNSVTQPGGCSLTANPSSGSSSTNVTLTAACSSGTTPITLAWTGTGTGSCPTSMSGLSTTCTINNVSATTTWTVNFSNSAGNNNKSATYTQSTGGGGGFANCPAGSETITHAWGGGSTGTVITQGFGADNIVSIQVTIPVGTVADNKLITAVEYQDAQTTRDFALSRVACSFSAADALKTKNGAWSAIQNANTSPAITYGTTPNNNWYTAPSDGTPFYINIRNRNSAGGTSCASGSCNMLITIRK